MVIDIGGPGITAHVPNADIRILSKDCLIPSLYVLFVLVFLLLLMLCPYSTTFRTRNMLRLMLMLFDVDPTRHRTL